MSGNPSAEEKPEADNIVNRPNPIPEPSPDFEQAKTDAWEKETDPTPAAEPAKTAKPEAQLIDRSAGQTAPVKGNEALTWAILAHLSVLLNLVTGFLGGFAAIIIYFVFKDRSRFVAYHAMQSFIFQAIAWLGAGLISGVLITIGGVFSFLILPLLCLIPGFLILLLIPISLIYGVVGAVQVSNGADFSYWLVGDWVRGILEPKPLK